MKEYGVSNPSQLDKSKKNRIKTNIAKYGVINISQSKSIKEKKKQSSIRRYGVTNVSKSIEVKLKKQKTTFTNYGVNSPFESKEIRDRHTKILQLKYGEHITNISQIPSVMDKKLITGISAKNYCMPSGKIVRIQGYENYGIEHLIKKGLSEDDLIIGNTNIETEIGRFYFTDTRNNKKRRYFPDIFVKSENKIYEIKSTYTMTLDIELILMKKKAITDLNFAFEFLVFNDKGIKQD